jgi:hypothetical protein
LHGWDIANKIECDRIHKLESKAFASPPEPKEVQAKIIELAESWRI